jgi:hypothetical protein
MSMIFWPFFLFFGSSWTSKTCGPEVMLAEWVFWDGQMMSRGESLCLVHGNDMAQELPMYRGDLERACIGDEKTYAAKTALPDKVGLTTAPGDLMLLLYARHVSTIFN